MRKIFSVVFIIISLLCFGYGQNYQKLYDGEWYELHFSFKKYVLVRLQGDGRWVMKRYDKNKVVDVERHFFYECGRYYDITDFRVDDDPLFIGDYRISFNCCSFVDKITADEWFIGLEEAYPTGGEDDVIKNMN